jgi:hypothetical protein
VCNARVNRVSAKRPGLAKIIEKIQVSIYFESAVNNHHIADNAGSIDYTEAGSSKRVY